ncbi:hypothetical protein LPMP_351830 [Leishmania panamensis]|uniref:Uncharacterized protein n=1 Tax=Leishmania panamensis TaxID=5679 RepID=A0A088S3Z7_LEIPA|nr:hypothetical protein LPMP_351830 [Leishmania panamensis]AIO02320.1 hypothetical protein LPMP_351830 [Leishmania panamensis]
MPAICFSSPFNGGTRGNPASSITAFKVREKHEAGMRLLQEGLVYEAIQLFQEASFFDVENVRPIVALAECYVFLCDLRSAIRCYWRTLWSLDKKEMDDYCCRANGIHTDTDDRVSAADNRRSDASNSPAGEWLKSGEETLFSALPDGSQETHEYDFEAAQKATPASFTAVEDHSPSDPSTPYVAGGIHSVERAACFSEPQRPLAKSVEAAAHAGPSLAPRSQAPRAELTVKDIRARLAGVLDALGLSLYRVGSVEQALRCTTEALELLDDAARAGEGGRNDMYVSKSSQLLTDPTISLHRGVYLMALQRDEEAEALLEAHFAVFLQWRPQAAALLVQLYCNRQAFRKARMLLEVQEKADSGNPDSSKAPTEVHGNLDEVLRSGRGDTVSPSPPSAAAPESLAVAKYLFTELYARYRTAAFASNNEASITRCLGIYPNDIDLLFRRAQLNLSAGKPKQSVKDLFRCVRETNGEHKEAMEAMTKVLFTIGLSLNGEAEMQDAVTYYSESLKWRPDNVLVLLARGDCYTKMESFEAALADYESVLCFAPGQRDARQRIASLHDLWGRKLFAQGQPEQAEAEFTNAIKTDGQNPQFYYHRALCRLKLDQGRYALRDVLSCKELHPCAPHLCAFIARYLELVQPPEASQRGNTSRTSARQVVAGPVRAALPPPHRGTRAAHTPPALRDRGGPPALQRMHDRNTDDTPFHSANGGPSTATSVLPRIKRQVPKQKRAELEGWVRGCRTTLHQRETGAPAPVK